MDGYPACPNGRHKGSKVTRAGMDGPPGGPKRQRWWCEPKTGRKHRFRETLPRIIGHDEEGHTCPECASRLEPWEGQPAPRLYGYPVRDIAWALARVSEGQPYRSVAAQVRARAGRMLDTERRKDPVTKKWLAAANEHGQLVSDWVEVYAPVIWSAYAPTGWPSQAILDEDEMRYTRPGVARGVRAFYVLAVFGYTPRGHRYVASIEAVPRLSIQAWQRHLSRLDGAPDIIVSDGGQPITGAVARVWPDTETRRCEYHLARNLTEALPREVQRDLDDPLHEALTGATSSLDTWEAFLTTLQNRAHREPEVFTNALTVAAKLDPVIRGQLPTRKPMGMNSTGPLEHFYRELDQHIGDRAAKMTNKRRADALLMLLAARYNRWGSEKSWTDLIRNHLTTAKGRASERSVGVENPRARIRTAQSSRPGTGPGSRSTTSSAGGARSARTPVSTG